MSFESQANIETLTYTNSSMKLTETLSSELHLNNIEIDNIELTQHMVDYIDCYNIRMQNMIIYDISTTKNLVYMSGSEIDLIENITIHDISATALYIQKSNINTIDKIKIYDVQKCIHAK